MHLRDADEAVPKQDSINKPDFIQRFQRELGVSLPQADKFYDVMVRVFEDAIVRGAKIKVGHVGIIIPVRRPPREIRMGFSVGKGKKVKKTTRIYNIDSRLDFKFRVYRKFIDSRSLHWFDPEENIPPS